LAVVQPQDVFISEIVIVEEPVFLNGNRAIETLSFKEGCSST